MTNPSDPVWEKLEALADLINEWAPKVKKGMKEKNVRQGKAKCPSCGEPGACVVVLAGRKDHLHAKCTKCNFVMME